MLSINVIVVVGDNAVPRGPSGILPLKVNVVDVVVVNVVVGGNAVPRGPSGIDLLK